MMASTEPRKIEPDDACRCRRRGYPFHYGCAFDPDPPACGICGAPRADHSPAVLSCPMGGSDTRYTPGDGL